MIVADPVILENARKHGVADDDMLQACRNPIRVFDLDSLIMLIGPGCCEGLAHPTGLCGSMRWLM